MIERKPRRSKEYSHYRAIKGPPKLTVRFDIDVQEWLKGRHEGVRVYLQALIRADMRAAEVADSGWDPDES